MGLVWGKMVGQVAHGRNGCPRQSSAPLIPARAVMGAQEPLWSSPLTWRTGQSWLSPGCWRQSAGWALGCAAGLTRSHGRWPGLMARPMVAWLHQDVCQGLMDPRPRPASWSWSACSCSLRQPWSPGTCPRGQLSGPGGAAVDGEASGSGFKASGPSSFSSTASGCQQSQGQAGPWGLWCSRWAEPPHLGGLCLGTWGGCCWLLLSVWGGHCLWFHFLNQGS